MYGGPPPGARMPPHGPPMSHFPHRPEWRPKDRSDRPPQEWSKDRGDRPPPQSQPPYS